MQSITIVGYLTLVVRNVVNNQGKFKMSASDNICVLATISNAFRIAILANARYAYYADRNTISAADLARYVEAGVIFEFIYYSAGAVSSNIFMVTTN